MVFLVCGLGLCTLGFYKRFYGFQVLESGRIPCGAQDFLDFFFKLGKRVLKSCGGFRGHFFRLPPVDSVIQHNSGNAN